MDRYIDELYKRAFVEVELSNITKNYKEIKNMVGDGVNVMCILKADAYGHGDVEVFKELYSNGARFFGVSNIIEGERLLSLNNDSYVLNLGYLDEKLVNEAVKIGLKQTIVSLEHARNLNRELKNIDKKLTCHIKLDTGMTRLGVDCVDNDPISYIEEIFNMENIDVDGIYTHFSVADELNDSSKNFFYNQLNLFRGIVEKLEKKGYNIKYKHCANSPSILMYKESYFNLVRPGTILYGLSPSNEIIHKMGNLKQCFSLKAQVSLVKYVKSGRSVSYGRKFNTNCTTKLASITIGYADGYPRHIYNKAYAVFNGRKCKVVGKVCMDQIVIDVTDVKDIKCGDIVTLIGNDKISLNASDFADITGTIPIDISSSLGKRLFRVYYKNNKIINKLSYI